jgi:hypothetical protein
MVIWINGPFGSGKTTLAEGLTKQVNPSLIFDPEYIGFLMKWSQDFQDVSLWRILTGGISGFLGKHFSGHVIIPMTITNPVYLNEIFGRISDRGVPLRHFFLTLDEDQLKSRIESDKCKRRDQIVREWRLSQIQRCIAAKHAMPKGTIFLSAQKTTQELEADIRKAL